MYQANRNSFDILIPNFTIFLIRLSIIHAFYTDLTEDCSLMPLRFLFCHHVPVKENAPGKKGLPVHLPVSALFYQLPSECRFEYYNSPTTIMKIRL